MKLSDAIILARKRGRGVRRRYWSDRSVVIAWETAWYRAKQWNDDNKWAWTVPVPWSPGLEDMLFTGWVTCRP